MTPDQLTSKLKSMYGSAFGRKTTMVHLFAVLYADELDGCDTATKEYIAEKATGHSSYAAEFNKMIRLAEHVKVKDSSKLKFT